MNVAGWKKDLDSGADADAERKVRFGKLSRMGRSPTRSEIEIKSRSKVASVNIDGTTGKSAADWTNLNQELED